MSDKKQGRLSVHPYIGGTTANLVKNIIKNGGIDKGREKMFLVTFVGTLLTAPIRLLEYILYSKKIDQMPIKQDPIFIIGHWRSGTTHLHNVISQDKNLGYLTTLQAVFPTCSAWLSNNKLAKKLVAKLIPQKRMMDNMKMNLDYPQEEEFSVSCITTSSHHCNHFPKTIEKSFNKYVLFDTDEKEKKKWKESYLKVIKKASFLANGKQLVLKNPYNTARIKMLLELFPNAKFIYIYRNPYNIYLSALHDFIKEAEEMAWQDYSEKQFSDTCYKLYKKLLNAYWENQHLIPEGNLSEVSYEAFEANPLLEFERIYEELGMNKSAETMTNVKKYLDSISDYKKNKYSYNASTVKEIGEKWRFAIKKMNYSPPTDIPLNSENSWSCRMDP